MAEKNPQDQSSQGEGVPEPEEEASDRGEAMICEEDVLEMVDDDAAEEDGE